MTVLGEIRAYIHETRKSKKKKKKSLEIRNMIAKKKTSV